MAARSPALAQLARTFARLRARWARQGLAVRQLATEADKIAKAPGIGHLRRARRQVAAGEAILEIVGFD